MNPIIKQILGYDPDECSPEHFTKEMQKTKEQMEEEAARVVEQLASSGWGNFIKQGLGFLQTLVGGAAVAGMALASQAVVAPVLRTVTAIVGTVYALVPGFKLVLLMIAVSRLQESLEKRIQFSRALRKDILFIQTTINLIIWTKNQVDNSSTDTLKRAYNYIRSAQLKIGREAGKVSGNSITAPINEDQLRRSLIDLTKAIDELTFGASELTPDLFREYSVLNKEFGISVSSNGRLSIAKPFSAEQMIKELKENAQKLGPRGDEYLRRALLMSFLGPYLLAIASIHILYPVYRRIGEKLPTATALLAVIPGTDQIPEIPDMIASVIGVQVQEVDYPSGTYASVSIEVRIREAVVVNLALAYDAVQNTYGAAAQYLLPANNILTKVRDDIADHLRTGQTSLSQTGGKRAEWAVQVGAARELVSYAIPQDLIIEIDGKAIPIQSYNIQERAKTAFELYDALIEKISSKYTPQEPAAKVVKIGQTWFNLSIASPLLLFGELVKKEYRTQYIANLASMGQLLRKQEFLDRDELELCYRLKAQISQIPGYTQLDQVYQDQISSLGVLGADDAVFLGMTTGDLTYVASQGLTVLGELGGLSNSIDAGKCAFTANEVTERLVSNFASSIGEVTDEVRASMKSYEQRSKREMSYLQNKIKLYKILGNYARSTTS